MSSKIFRGDIECLKIKKIVYIHLKKYYNYLPIYSVFNLFNRVFG